MNIAYIADPTSVHNYKWIDYFSKQNNVLLICERNADTTVFKANPAIKLCPVLPRVYPLRDVAERKKTVTAIKNILKGNKIDVVHAMYAVPYAFWAYHTGFANYIVTTRGSDMLVDYNVTYSTPKTIREKLNSYFLKRLVEKSLNGAKFITSTSMAQQRVIRTFVKEESKLRLVRTGVNTEWFLRRFDECKEQKQGYTILSNRAMSSLYNIDVLVEAFAKLKQGVKDKNLNLVLLNFNTKGNYYNSIVELIKKLGLADSIKILDSQTQDELVTVYKNIDCIVMIPSSDGTPVSGIETMLSKKPLLIGPADYDTDLFNEQTTWKVSKIDSDVVANKLREIIEAPAEMVARKTNEALKAAIERADTQKEMEKVKKLYEVCLKS